MNEPLVLGIESTCDETGVAFVKGHQLLADVTASSMDQHARYGGIIPEIASRAHLESFIPTLQAAAKEAGVNLDQVDAIACAAGPGLVGSLTVGISAAKAIALALGKPIYGVNHVIGHLAVDQLEHGAFPDRFIGLIVSGGHSNLVLVEDIATSVRELGGTLDDAAGEAFDKVGRLLHTPYPGGPHVDRLSQEGDRRAIRFPRGLHAGKDKERHRYNFSFSGLKTAVARYVEGLEQQGIEVNKPNICAGFSEAVNDSLTAKAIQAAKDFGCSTIVVGGGFSANSRLRSLLVARGESAGIEIRIPKLRFCTDNGAQIAALGANLVAAGCLPSPIDFGPDSSLSLSVSYLAPRADSVSQDSSLVEGFSIQGENSFEQAIQCGQRQYQVTQEASSTVTSEFKEETIQPGPKLDLTDIDRGTPAIAPVGAPLMERVKENMSRGIDQMNRGIDQMKPSFEHAYEKVEQAAELVYEKAEQAYEKALPYVEQATEKAKPYVEQATEKAKPYVEQVTEKAKPYVEQMAEKARPYVEQATEKAKPYVEQAKPHMEQAAEATRSYAQQVGGIIQQAWTGQKTNDPKNEEPSVSVEPPDDVPPRK